MKSVIYLLVNNNLLTYLLNMAKHKHCYYLKRHQNYFYLAEPNKYFYLFHIIKE